MRPHLIFEPSFNVKSSKSAYNMPISGYINLGCEVNLKEVIDLELLSVMIFYLDPSFKVKENGQP